MPHVMYRDKTTAVIMGKSNNVKVAVDNLKYSMESLNPTVNNVDIWIPGHEGVRTAHRYSRSVLTFVHLQPLPFLVCII